MRTSRSPRGGPDRRGLPASSTVPVNADRPHCRVSPEEVDGRAGRGGRGAEVDEVERVQPSVPPSRVGPRGCVRRDAGVHGRRRRGAVARVGGGARVVAGLGGVRVGASVQVEERGRRVGLVAAPVGRDLTAGAAVAVVGDRHHGEGPLHPGIPGLGRRRAIFPRLNRVIAGVVASTGCADESSLLLHAATCPTEAAAKIPKKRRDVCLRMNPPALNAALTLNPGKRPIGCGQ